MEAFRFYEITAELPEGRIAGQFIETAGVLQPTMMGSDRPVIDEWKIDDDISGAQIRLILRGDIHAKRLVPLNSDPAFRLMRLYGTLACVRAGIIAHGMEKLHYFRYADSLETCVTADVLSKCEHQNIFLESLLGSWRNHDLAQLPALAAIAGIDPHASEEELRRTLRNWYADGGTWSTRIAGFAHQASQFLRVENGVEKSKLAKGDECRLVREPYNPADPNAVMVMHQSGRKIGYLRRTIATYVASIMDLGAVYRSKICAFLPDEFATADRVYLVVERLG